MCFHSPVKPPSPTRKKRNQKESVIKYLPKVGKSSNIGQDQKTLISNFAQLVASIARDYFLDYFSFPNFLRFLEFISFGI